MMPDEKMDNAKIDDDLKNTIQFKIDQPIRMFVGEIKGDMVKKISPGELEGFKDADKVVVMHSEDWLWFFNRLDDVTKRSAKLNTNTMRYK